MMKKLAIVLGIVVLLIAGLIVVASLLSLDSYRGVIEDKASAAIGRKVSLKGSLGLTFFPRPGVSIEQIEIGNVAGAKDPLFASVQRVKAFVAVWPLFQKRIEVASLSVDEPQLFLEQLEGDKNNWTFEIAKNEEKGGFEVSIQDVKVADARISYRKGESIEIVAVDSASVEMQTLSGPFEIDAELTAVKIPLEISAKIGALATQTPIELHVRSDKTTVNGQLTWERPTNRFSGQLDAEIDPALIEKVKPGTKLPKVLAEPFKIKGNIGASSEAVKLSDLIVGLKDQTMKGSIDLVFKPAVSLKLSLNGLPGQSDFNLVASSEAGAWGGSISANIKSLFPLLKWLEVSADSIPLKLSKDIALKTNFEVNAQSRLRDLALSVGQARVNGDVTYESQKENQKLSFNLSTPNADALLAAAEKELANPIGAADVSGSINGTDKHMHFSLKPHFAASEMSFEGDAYDLKDKLRFDSSVYIKTSRLSALAKLLGTKLPEKIESATITGRAKGTLDNVELDLKTQIESLALNAKGVVSDLKKSPSVDLAIDASDPDFRILMSTLALPTSVPEGRMIASLKLKGPTKNLQANGLKLTIGPNFSASGDFTLNREQAKSFVKAQISASALDITENEKPNTASQGSSSWSSKPIDFTFLNNMNADIEFRASSLKRKDIVVQNPKISVKVNDGKAIMPLSGTIFGGGFNATATLLSNGVATVKADLNDANVQSLVAKHSDVKLVDGRLSVNTDLAMQGKSIKELVSSLRGKVGFNSKDGKINGFDLQAISRQISSFKDWTSVLQLLTTSLNGGQTNYQAFNGQLNFENGVGSFQGLKLTADAAQAEAKGNIDVLNDNMNVRVDVKLTEQPNLPPIGMRLEGPIGSPRRVLDTTALQTYLVRNVFTNVLENVKSGRINDVKDPVDLLNKVFGRPSPPPGSSNPQGATPPSQNQNPSTPPRSEQKKSKLQKTH